MQTPKAFFERLATSITRFTGSNTAFTSALIINTGTTIITFLMVFLIQKSQNKDSMAMQIKLDELIAASDLASNRIVSVEEMSEDELKIISRYYTTLSDLAKRDEKLTLSHSIDEAEKLHDSKKKKRKTRIVCINPNLMKLKSKINIKKTSF